jgi:hypothetical protein
VGVDNKGSCREFPEGALITSIEFAESLRGWECPIVARISFETRLMRHQIFQWPHFSDQLCHVTDGEAEFIVLSR